MTMFSRRCASEVAHDPHTYTQHWVKSELPLLPDHVAEQLSNEWDVVYNCPGIEERVCVECETELVIDTIMVNKTSVFCPNMDCVAFAKSFWVDK